MITWPLIEDNQKKIQENKSINVFSQNDIIFFRNQNEKMEFNISIQYINWNIHQIIDFLF